jgi:hypothetical protein|tara:strand:+ start:1212 stop:1382 length:171 start_codon:yes stop_codon:yes gene_type:complete
LSSVVVVAIVVISIAVTVVVVAIAVTVVVVAEIIIPITNIWIAPRIISGVPPTIPS